MTSLALHTTLSFTEDAGNSPRNQESNAKAVDQNTGVMYGTTDEGQSWHQLATVGQVTSMSFIDDMSGWIMSQNGFQRTTNGGQSWQSIYYYYPH